MGKMLMHPKENYKFLAGNPEIAKKFGLPPKAKWLGEGTQGVAYDIGSNRVLKLTKDDDEAKVSAWVMKNPIAGVWKLHHVFYSSKLQTYGIIGEKLREDDNKSRKVLQMIQLAMDEVDRGLDYFDTKDYAMIELIIEELDNLEYEYPKKIIAAAKDIAYAMHELDNAGIRWEDLHEANLLWKGGSPKIIDLGYSVGRKGKVEIVENRWYQ